MCHHIELGWLRLPVKAGPFFVRTKPASTRLHTAPGYSLVNITWTPHDANFKFKFFILSTPMPLKLELSCHWWNRRLASRRRSHDRLIFTMEIPIHGKTVFILRRSPVFHRHHLSMLYTSNYMSAYLYKLGQLFMLH